MTIRTRTVAMSLSAAALVAIAGYEGYSAVAYVPVAGDVPTIGWGTTGGVKAGDTIKPTAALQRLYRDAELAKASIDKCVKVPLSQNELDTYVSLSYNIGSWNFCHSTLVKKLNAGDYAGACAQIKRWNYQNGKPNKGLTNRRAKEYQTCIKQ